MAQDDLSNYLRETPRLERQSGAFRPTGRGAAASPDKGLEQQ